jgi:micrococcal nuclease
MLQRFLCCFRTKNKKFSDSLVSNSLVMEERNIDTISVRITDGETPNRISILDTRSLYDSNEWLNKLDKPIALNDCVPFVPPIDKGIVIKVYDGDTITIASKLPYLESPLYRFSVRLNGIDCPEIKGEDEHEKTCAQIAKKELSDLILNKVVTLQNLQTEKYGRILADVYINDLHLNKYMVEKRLAVVYDGGTKISPKNWMSYYYTGEL